ncbi:hypothetical protein OG991_47755 [Streptomyces mirabilis]|nr:hypothetical protein [Streptomyces mirabilis]MCX4427086.1 hypothetical protein [Streptomyces mirabilis]
MFVQHAAEPVEVRGRTGRVVQCQLRGRVGGGAQYQCAVRERDVIGHLGDAEVHDLHGAVVGHQQVRGFDVPVQDARGVGGGQRAGRLRTQVRDPVRGQLDFGQ